MGHPLVGAIVWRVEEEQRLLFAAAKVCACVLGGRAGVQVDGARVR